MIVGWSLHDLHGSAGARHMAFDDLEWVSDSSFRLGDRVWAQGREAMMEQVGHMWTAMDSLYT